MNNHEDLSDKVRPTSKRSAEVLTASFKTWGSLYETARSLTSLLPSCSKIDGLLNRTPSLPNNTKTLELQEGDFLLIDGGSQWEIKSSGACDLDKVSMSLLDHKVIIGSKTLAPCSFTRSTHEWQGFASRSTPDERPNLMGILVLGWAYILSVRTVELFGGLPDNDVSYTTTIAPCCNDRDASPLDQVIDLRMGKIDQNEKRWWCAILANGVGWSASMRRGQHCYYPPWSMHCHTTCQFRLLHSTPMQDRSERPPSSRTAFTYLWAFCERYQIQDQFSASLAAALTLPRHNRFGASIQLPLPTLPSASSLGSSQGEQPRVRYEQLSSYAALSTMPRALVSALCGTFWEAGVECNVASEWLHVITKEILPPIEQEQQGSTIVNMMAIRRPTLASLWLGTFVTGLLPTLLKHVATSLPPLSLEAAVWTKSPQSFMDPPNAYQPGSVASNSRLRQTMRRQDELRLLFLTRSGPDGYQRPPLSPWPPFGSIDLQTSAFEAQLHASCQHSMEYMYWTWRLKDGCLLKDAGMSTEEEETVALPHPAAVWSSRIGDDRASCCQVTEDASRVATRDVFGWAMFEGRRTGEGELWRHEWLQDMDFEDESEGNSDLSSAD